MTKKRDYEVGYGKPPIHTRFKKGQSGNPKGRPKGSNNFSTDVKSILATKVPVTEAGRRRNVSTQQATLLRLREKALKGDAKSMDGLLSLAGRHNDAPIETDVEAVLDEDDDAILAAALARRARSHGSPDDGTE